MSSLLCESVDCVWEEWDGWNSCTETCGGGTWQRTRTPFGPFYDGDPCTGLAEETGFCNDNPCPGGWQYRRPVLLSFGLHCETVHYICRIIVHSLKTHFVY